MIDELVEAIKRDRVSGASQLTVKAAESFLRLYESGGRLKDMRELARLLISARPSMPSIANVSSLILSKLESGERAVDAVKQVLSDYREAVSEAIKNAVEYLSGIDAVLTHSYSSTVKRVLLKLGVKVYLTESRPGREGVKLAEELVDKGLRVVLLVDAAVSQALMEVDAVLVGCDAVFRDGSFANKVGTKLIALAAEELGKPFYVVLDTWKTVVYGYRIEEQEPSLVYEGDPRINVMTPLFEVTPGRLVERYLTEYGPLTLSELREKIEDAWSRFTSSYEGRRA